MAVIVMGVSGCGKSTVGALLGKALGCGFLEGDSYHHPDSVRKMKAGIPLNDEDRWPWLDRLGQAAAEAVAKEGVVVVACSALRRVYRERLQSAIAAPTRFILLDNDRDELLRRLTARSHAFMPTTLLDSQLATLERPGSDEPAKTLVSDVPPDALCRMAADWLSSDLTACRSGQKAFPPLG